MLLTKSVQAAKEKDLKSIGYTSFISHGKKNLKLKLYFFGANILFGN